MCPHVWFENPKSVILHEGMGTFAGTYQLEILDAEDKHHRLYILGDRRTRYVFEDEHDFWKAWKELRQLDGLDVPDWSRASIDKAVAEFERKRNERN